ncbi:RNA polymerase sigma-70 factor (ECF subfamily) [Archangium gephyra]|uniref:DNA-binding regulatory protein n=1 Tax=Archangium gephyra TaxID=48 RepID=A0AAC8QCW2_9BACT|nr:sigma-70 family RNA polymerase sigma factor [Archangium gephyra]AKJ05410.1 putative DNA-binding regulatory protein [Archangium gephyra]REG36094.1 RNA polymerase sigma-70 factor (ECF subfamily) [Archangium gephyra]
MVPPPPPGPADSPAPEPEALRAAALALLPEPVAHRWRDDAGLGPLLKELFEASATERAAHGVTDEAWLNAVLRPLSKGGELEALRTPHAGDLALAVGCAAGRPSALSEFDRRFTRELTSSLRRVDPSPDFVDEALQALRERLLLPGEEGPPRIATYEGTGPLSGWVRAVALRLALNLRRGDTPKVPLDERLASGLELDAPGPELSLLKHQYRQAFQEAFRAALAGLSDQELNVLRLHYVSGVSLERLGETYGVHRATVARWLASARERLLQGTRRELQARLNVGADEFQQIIELVRSQLALTLSRALA